MKGLIFDMDGTMVDNMMVHHRAWQQMLWKYEIDMSLSEVKEKIHGINEEILLRLYGDRFTAEERKRMSDQKEAAYRSEFIKNLKLVDGLQTLLEACHSKGVPMAIGSAAPPENVDFVLDNLAIRHYFKGVMHSKSVSKGKPDPEIFIKAAASMNLLPSDCIVFEDSITGAETARKAGALAIILTTTHDEVEFTGFSNVLKCIPDFTSIQLDTLLSLSSQSR